MTVRNNLELTQSGLGQSFGKKLVKAETTAPIVPGSNEVPKNSWPAKKTQKAMKTIERTHMNSKASVLGSRGTDITQSNIFLVNSWSPRVTNPITFDYF